MPFFRFLLHGEGIRLTDGAAGGFYTTRWVHAATIEKAAEKAIAIVMADWTKGRSSRLSPGQPPQSVTIDEGWPISLLDIPKAPNRGNVIYSGDYSEEPGWSVLK